METQVIKWGNSQGIRLPKALLQACNIQVNDHVTIIYKDDQIIIKKAFHRTLEERAEKYGGKLGPYEEFDWGSPEGNEVW